MLYKSTRGGESDLTFETVLLSAYASDGGLYIPQQLPRFDRATLLSWQAESFSLAQVAGELLHAFTSLPKEDCHELATAAFGTFLNPKSPVSLQKVQTADGLPLIFLDTGAGPTLAFKDIGQQLVAQLLNYYLGRRGKHANVMLDTSGDTGPAAVAGVKGCEHVDIWCLYPAGRVSAVQELQLLTVTESNVHIYRSNARDQDENAQMMKELFSDNEFMQSHNVCSVNSINWARIAAQSSYYIWAW
jgi:threonine synthase